MCIGGDHDRKGFVGRGAKKHQRCVLATGGGVLLQMIDFATVLNQRVKLLLSKLEASNVEATTSEVFQVCVHAGLAPRKDTRNPSLPFFCRLRCAGTKNALMMTPGVLLIFSPLKSPSPPRDPNAGS